ncbi:MAG: AMIN-like domain-containing (lipo)protein [Gemmatimonadaceae bacterium]
MASHRRSLRSTALLALIAAASAIAACGGGNDAGPPSAGGPSMVAEPPVAESPPATATTPGDTSPDGAVADTTGPTGGAAVGTISPTAGGVERDGVATLLAVRVATRPESAAERVVFEFDGDAVPHYEIAYARPPFSQCGSGQPVAVAGDAVLRVRLRATRAHAESGEDVRPTVTERNRTLDQPLLRQLILTCDFEGEVEWVLGVSARRPYSVRELDSPARLVVDVSSRE